MAQAGIPTKSPNVDGGYVGSILAALATPAGQHNPYPHCARLHMLAPAAVGPDGALVVAGYHHCAAVLKDHRLQKFPARLLTASGYPDWQQHPALKMMVGGMLMINPPEHPDSPGRLGRFHAGAGGGAAPGDRPDHRRIVRRT